MYLITIICYFIKYIIKTILQINKIVVSNSVPNCLLLFSGESARKDSIAGPEVLAQQQAVMAAVEAEIKQKNSVVNSSAFSSV